MLNKKERKRAVELHKEIFDIEHSGEGGLMNYTKGPKINFHEIDENGNHVMRLVGDDQEHRIDLMAASEDLYEALRGITAQFSLVEPLYAKDREYIAQADKALKKTEGTNG